MYVTGALEYNAQDAYDALGTTTVLPFADVIKLLIKQDIIGCVMAYIPESCIESFNKAATGQPIV